MPAEIRSCPACGVIKFRPAGSTVPGCEANAGGKMFYQPSYSVRECSECGLLYKDNTASSAELDDYYSRTDFRKWETAGFYPTERAALTVLRTLSKGSCILDFGCSSGRLLAPLTQDYKCFGFEINREAAAMAATKGLCMLPTGFWETDEGPRFDAILLMDVFEHLSAPADLLLKLYTNLKPGGLLLIVTGNGDSVVCRLDPAQFWYFRLIEHLCMLTRRNAEHLARLFGARLEYWQEMSHYDSSLFSRLKIKTQHFSYWQFRNQTVLARTILPLIPLLNRARRWAVAPGNSVTQDHVLAGFRKP